MAKAEKKVEMRDVLRNKVAQLVMAEFGMAEIARSKEGLVINVEDKSLVIRVIQKKERVEKADIVEVIKAKGAEGAIEVECETAEDVETQETE